MDVNIERCGMTFAQGHVALRSVSLAITHGERVAIVGPSGAGKTTLLRILGTSLRPSDGSLSIAGDDPWRRSPLQLRQLRARIGTIHQSPPLPPRQRVVTAVLAGRLGQWGVIRGLASLVYPSDLRGARAALARVGMQDRLFDRCDRLSGGQLQRVGIARVLYQCPDLILADEPVSALDPELASQIVRELNEDARTRKVTLIASLHAIDLALNGFPRIVGVNDGAVVFDLPPRKVSDAMLSDLYRGESTEAPAFNEPGVAVAGQAPISSRASVCR